MSVTTKARHNQGSTVRASGPLGASTNQKREGGPREVQSIWADHTELGDVPAAHLTRTRIAKALSHLPIIGGLFPNAQKNYEIIKEETEQHWASHNRRPKESDLVRIPYDAVMRNMAKNRNQFLEVHARPASGWEVTKRRSNYHVAVGAAALTVLAYLGIPPILKTAKNELHTLTGGNPRVAPTAPLTGNAGSAANPNTTTAPSTLAPTTLAPANSGALDLSKIPAGPNTAFPNGVVDIHTTPLTFNYRNSGGQNFKVICSALVGESLFPGENPVDAKSPARQGIGAIHRAALVTGVDNTPPNAPFDATFQAAEAAVMANGQQVFGNPPFKWVDKPGPSGQIFVGARCVQGPGA